MKLQSGCVEFLINDILYSTLNEHPTERHQMGLNARMIYKKYYTLEQNYRILMNIYQEAIEDARSYS